MKILVLDDTRKQADSIRGAFSNKKMDAVVCSSTNEFMTAVEASKFESVYVNAETWNRGRSIYDYFDVGSKIGSSRPMVFYNADEKFAGVAGRTPHERDRLLLKPATIETALDAA